MLALLSLTTIGLLGAIGAPATPAAAVHKQPRLLTAISNAGATPATITFSASNPDLTPLVSSSASVTVSWTATVSVISGWTVSVSAPAAFSSCSQIPASAITVTCSAVTGGTAGGCGSSTTLSTTPTAMAGGFELVGVNSPYSVTLNFTLQDSWQYIASSLCSLTLSYNITAN